MEKVLRVQANNVSKKYCRSLKRSITYGIIDITKDLFHLDTGTSKLRTDEFWALENISFELNAGECLAVVGRNGAGKSTLLKIINGIFKPDRGDFKINGTVAALIEVGVGFHPLLSGRENIYLNATILGMSKNEIEENVRSIIDFSELESAIDMPIKNYSSGMYVRLGFSIITHLNPDVLIVDEVLAVGDMAFRAKCLKYFDDYLSEKKGAVILVSHNKHDVSRLADKVLLLEDGKGKVFDDVPLALSEYELKMFQSNELVQRKVAESGFELAPPEKNAYLFEAGESISIPIRFRLSCRLEDVWLGFTISSGDGLKIVSDSMVLGDMLPNTYEADFSWDKNIFSQGVYQVGIFVWAANRTKLVALKELYTRIQIVDRELNTRKRDGVIIYPPGVKLKEIEWLAHE